MNQAKNNQFVTQLMSDACGDLILDGCGHLRARQPWNLDFTEELPWAQHRLGDLLAKITPDGWRLTSEGAQFILENCTPPSNYDARLLQQLANVRGDV